MEFHFLNIPVLTFFTFLFFLLRLRNKRRVKTNNGSTNLPPGPWKLPLIGNLHNLVGPLPHRRLRELASIHGPVMHLKLGEVSTVVVTSPEPARLIMKTHDAIFAQRPHIPASHILSYGSKNIVFSHGGYWRQLRKLCTTELLTVKRVKSFRSIREEEVQKLINTISSSLGSPVNLGREICSMTYGITGRASFGEKCKEQEEFIALVEEGTRLAAGFSLADVFPSIKLLRVLSGMEYQTEKLHRRFDTILNNIIDEHKSSRIEGSGMVRVRDGKADNLVDVLLNLQEDGDLEFPMTNDSIKAIVMDILSAGSETSSSTIEWIMSELVKNPIAMDKAQSEVRKVFSTKGFVDESGLEELQFLKCVIKETLRLHPPVPLLIPRECQEQCKINGFDIPFKTKVIINAWAIGRDPKYWIEPDRFYPERFLDSAVDFKGNNFEFVPFGAGRRICPGISFAMPNLELPLANLLYHFDWKVPNGLRNEDLDMTEAYGASVRRLTYLCLIAIPYQSQ